MAQPDATSLTKVVSGTAIYRGAASTRERASSTRRNAEPSWRDRSTFSHHPAGRCRRATAIPRAARRADDLFALLWFDKGALQREGQVFSHRRWGRPRRVSRAGPRRFTRDRRHRTLRPRARGRKGRVRGSGGGSLARARGRIALTRELEHPQRPGVHLESLYWPTIRKSMRPLGCQSRTL